MSKSNNIQPGHYRTYRESGKTIEVNGGPKSEYNGELPSIAESLMRIFKAVLIATPIGLILGWIIFG